MNKRYSLIVAACLSLSITEQASAYYAAHVGRFTSRDPRGEIGRNGMEMPPNSGMSTAFVHRDRSDAMAQYNDGNNLYQYVGDNPITLLDPMGLQAGVPGPILKWGWERGWNPPPQEPPIGPVTPLPPDSTECDKYKCDDSYAGASARCFCKCGGDNPWSNFVRGCLRDLYDAGVPPADAHRRCYEAADDMSFPGGRPWLTLGYCYAKCANYGSLVPPVEDHPLPTW